MSQKTQLDQAIAQMRQDVTNAVTLAVAKLNELTTQIAAKNEATTEVDLSNEIADLQSVSTLLAPLKNLTVTTPQGGEQPSTVVDAPDAASQTDVEQATGNGATPTDDAAGSDATGSDTTAATPVPSATGLPQSPDADGNALSASTSASPLDDQSSTP